MSHTYRYAALVMLSLAPIRSTVAQDRGAGTPATTPGRMTVRLRMPAWFGLALECEDCESTRLRSARTRTPPIIARIWPGGPAERASLQVGDTILAADGKELTAPELRAKLVAAPTYAAVRLLVAGRRGRYTYAILPRPAPLESVGTDSLPIRYHGEFATVTVDVLTMSPPVVTRDSSGAMLIQLGGHVIRLQRTP